MTTTQPSSASSMRTGHPSSSPRARRSAYPRPSTASSRPTPRTSFAAWDPRLRLESPSSRGDQTAARRSSRPPPDRLRPDRASTMLGSTRPRLDRRPTRIAIMPAAAHAREKRRVRTVIGLASVYLLAACASASATPVPTPTPSPTPTVVPSPSGGTFSVSPAAQAYLLPLAGYEYVVLPTALEQQMASGFASNPAVVSVIKGYAASSV